MSTPGENGRGSDLDAALVLYADAETRRRAIPIGAAADRFRPNDPDSLTEEMTDVLRRARVVEVPAQDYPDENMTEKSVTAFSKAFPDLELRTVRALANRWAFFKYS